MKLAIVAAAKAFASQIKENIFESAKKTVEKQGYVVTKKQKDKEPK